MADVFHVGMDEILGHFQDLEDPRSSVNQQHPLVSVVVLAILAILAGSGGPTAIARWAALKRDLLLTLLDLPTITAFVALLSESRDCLKLVAGPRSPLTKRPLAGS